MNIQTAIDGLEKEREEIKKEINNLFEILITISEALPDVPSCHKEWPNHPATKYLAERASELKCKKTRLCKAIKQLKAILEE